MSNSPCAVTGQPVRVSSPSGLSIECNHNGSIRRIDCGDIMLNVFLGNEVEGGPANLFLRRHGPVMEVLPLLGPSSRASCHIDDSGMCIAGSWHHLNFRVRLVMASSATAWFWHVDIENTGPDAVTCDLIWAQDLGLAHYGALRLNEFYVSQYIDHQPMDHPQVGKVIASRQNQSMGGRYPWVILGALRRGTAFATDALQVYGLENRVGNKPVAWSQGLPSKRVQHEHSMPAIQDDPIHLDPGQCGHCGFFALFEPDHPAATSLDDLACVDAALALPEASRPPSSEFAVADAPAVSLFASATFLQTHDLTDTELDGYFGNGRRHAEWADGELQSFFVGRDTHVVLKSKELRVMRPHGHLLRTGTALTPDEAAMTSTAWMAGVFHSMVTQGHVSINRFLSTCHSYCGLFRSHGQRVFVDAGDGWKLLGIPSAFSMTPAGCRWIYKFASGVIEVIAEAAAECHELQLRLKVLDGPSLRFLVTHHVALNGDDGSASTPARFEVDGPCVRVRAIADSDVGRRFPDGWFEIVAGPGRLRVSGDEGLFPDGKSRQQPIVCLMTEDASLGVELCLRGHLVEPAEKIADASDASGAYSYRLAIAAPGNGQSAAAAERLGDIFPWLLQNGLVHYLSPRGLEQYSGGGWGTRDVCQGPVELLLALGEYTAIRDLLVRVFCQQNPDGDWPQWFMFFERERNIRPGDSHGDIVYWPLLALAQYLEATRDASLLQIKVPYFHPDGPAVGEPVTLLEHVECAMALINRRVIEGTCLAAYGHGDWNDSLQPAKPDMRERLCSAWTVTLNYQTLVALASACRQLDLPEQAGRLETQAALILKEFQKLLVVDGVVAGLAYFHGTQSIDYLLHPRDASTGLCYSLLPMIHAIINDMFTPEQAAEHLQLIEDHLLGPDGAHLFDRPMAYRGGIQTNFQRAETASYFGREIGIMYTHAHLRYAEALAHYGDANGFFRALAQLNPIGLQEWVPCAAARQANCYYSSSDPAFADRYEAFADYDKVMRGEVSLEGGWRVYSSGAGIGVRLIMQCFLGLRLKLHEFTVDPVIPPALDGLEVNLTLAGHPITVRYHVGTLGSGPTQIRINGREITTTRETNPYRTGGLRVPISALTTHRIDHGNNLMEVWTA